jgi:hypothetical protein
MHYSALFIVAVAALAAAAPQKYGEPGYKGPAPKYGEPGYQAPAYGEKDKGYGYGSHKGETRPFITERIAGAIGEVAHGIHHVGHEIKEDIKSDVHHILNWMTCHIGKFKKYWKLKLEYRRNRRCEFKKLEKEKLEKFERWCAEHKAELRLRLKECSDSSSSSSEKAIYNEAYEPPACGSTGPTCAKPLY